MSSRPEPANIEVTKPKQDRDLPLKSQLDDKQSSCSLMPLLKLVSEKTMSPQAEHARVIKNFFETYRKRAHTPNSNYSHSTNAIQADSFKSTESVCLPSRELVDRLESELTAIVDTF